MMISDVHISDRNQIRASSAMKITRGGNCTLQQDSSESGKSFAPGVSSIASAVYAPKFSILS
jgi:hypothetical protein